jgi:hypothetical protein
MAFMGKKPLQVVSSDKNRNALEALRNDPNLNGRTMSPSFLRVEQKIVNGKPVYNFNLTKDTNSDSVTERKLDVNDSFLITEIGLKLMKRLSTKIGGEVLQTYPNIQEFADVSTTFLGADLEAFYNGLMELTVKQKVQIEAMDTNQFRYVSETQQSSASTKSSGDMHAGMVSITPNIRINGTDKNSLKVSAPVASSALVAHTTANTDNYLVLFIRGFLISQ